MGLDSEVVRAHRCQHRDEHVTTLDEPVAQEEEDPGRKGAERGGRSRGGGHAQLQGVDCGELPRHVRFV